MTSARTEQGDVRTRKQIEPLIKYEIAVVWSRLHAGQDGLHS